MMKQFEDKAHKVKIGLAEMLKGGVIMDVTNAEQAKIAEAAGAASVMALERVPSDIRAEGGVARMADLDVIDAIKRAVTIPVMAKCRIGHFIEARVLESMEIDFIDESEVLTPADEKYHVDKWPFKVPFVCGCRNLGEALRRISEGAAMIRTKGEAGTGDVSQAVKHLREINSVMKSLTVMTPEEHYGVAKEYPRVDRTGEAGRANRQTAGAEFRRRRDRHAGRRRAVHASGGRGGVCRLGHFQIIRPGEAREGDCLGDDALAGFRDHRGVFARIGCGDEG